MNMQMDNLDAVTPALSSTWQQLWGAWMPSLPAAETRGLNPESISCGGGF